MEVLKRFVYPLGEKQIEDKVNAFKKAGLSTLESAILANRNIDISSLDEVLNMNIDDMVDARLMKDALKAAKLINDSLTNKEPIVIYSDYDCDGWGSAVVGHDMLTELSSKLGFNFVPNIYINKRNMGYGICKKGIDDIMAKWPETKVILTADNGIVAFDAIDYANSLGLKVVVTDHHQPDSAGKIPNALAVVNPHQLDCKYPFKDLCGTAVLWKVLSISFFLAGISYKTANSYLDIVAVATVADVVSLKGENRIICYHGLKMITNNSRPQWKIFKDVFSDFEKIENVDTRTIGFSFAPAINAISRMTGDIYPAVEIFMTNDTTEITNGINRLRNVNKERKAITEDLTNAAMVESELQEDYPMIILNNAEFFDGVVGLVAGRLREAWNKPVIVMTREGDNWKGSGRSIPGYHIKDALDNVQAKTGLITAYGGHSQACGLTVSDKNIIDFKIEMMDHADSIPQEAFVKNVIVDYEASEDEIDAQFFDKIKNLEPFGNSFEEPIIGIKDFVPTEVKFIGSDQQHIILKGKTFDVVSWYGARVVEAGIPSSFTVCGRLTKDNFGIKLMVDPDDIQC